MSRLRALREELVAHEPVGPRETWSHARILTLLDWLPHPFDEHDDPSHVTGSAIVVDEDSRVLLHRHKRLGRWLQPGGHVDPGETPAQAAVRETHEESGLVVTHPPDGPCLIHVDVHEGPRGHLHLDLRYLLVGDGRATLAPAADESPEVAWWSIDEARALGDASLRAAITAAARRLGTPDA